MNLCHMKDGKSISLRKSLIITKNEAIAMILADLGNFFLGIRMTYGVKKWKQAGMNLEYDQNWWNPESFLGWVSRYTLNPTLFGVSPLLIATIIKIVLQSF